VLWIYLLPHRGFHPVQHRDVVRYPRHRVYSAAWALTEQYLIGGKMPAFQKGLAGYLTGYDKKKLKN